MVLWILTTMSCAYGGMVTARVFWSYLAGVSGHRFVPAHGAEEGQQGARALGSRPGCARHVVPERAANTTVTRPCVLHVAPYVAPCRTGAAARGQLEGDGRPAARVDGARARVAVAVEEDDAVLAQNPKKGSTVCDE